MKTKFPLFLVTALFTLLAVCTASAATKYSVATGNWNATSTWATSSGGTAGAAVPVAGDDVIIEGSYTVTLNANTLALTSLTISSGAIFATTGAFTVSATTITVNGTYRNASSGAVTGTMTFNSGGLYQHNFTTTIGTIPKATWSASSTCAIIGYTSFAGTATAAIPGFTNQTFGNFTWACTNQTAGINFGTGNYTNIFNGNFTVLTTGTGTLYFRLSGTAGNPVLYINGDLIVSGGNIDLDNNGGTAGDQVIIYLAGNYNQTGGSVFTTTVTSGANVTLNFTGANKTFTQSGGSYNVTGTDRIDININSGASVTMNNNISLGTNTAYGVVVNSGGTLYTGNNAVTGSGTFTLQAGGTLGIGSAAGITSSGATGNIQTATRSFSTGANYVYNGTAAQAAGNGLPATVNSLTDNNTAGILTLSSTSATLITNAFALATGAKASLANGTTYYASSFTVNGVPQAIGSWGSTASTAANTSNAYFDSATTGILNTSPNSNNPRPVVLSGTRVYDGTTAAASGILTIANTFTGDILTLSGTGTLAAKDVGTETFVTGFQSPVRVQSATGNTATGTSTTIGVTTAATIAGNTLVAVISTRGTAVNQVSGITGGGTWSRATQSANANGTTTEIWYAPNISAGATTITITTASALRSAAVVIEYSGLLTASPLDQVNAASSTGSSTSPVTGTTPATTQANELLIGGVGFISSAPTLGTILNSFVSVANAASGSGTAGNNAKVYALESIVSATGAESSGGTLNVSAQWSGAIATFKAAPGTAPAGLSLSGSAAGKYTLVGASGSVSITAKALTAQGTLAGGGKVYNGLTTAAPTGSAALQAAEAAGAGTTSDGKPYSGDTVSLVGSVAYNFNSRNVATATTITGSGFSLTGAQAVNYSLTPPTLSAAISAKALTVSGITAPGTVYDGTTTAKLAGTAVFAAAEAAGDGSTSDGIPYSVDAVVPGGTAAGTLAAKDVGTRSVAITGVTVAGTGNGNYTVTQPTGLTQVVTPKSLTVTGLTASTRAADGTTAASLTGTAALLAAESAGSGSTSDGKPYTADTVSVTGTPAGTFATAAVGTGISVSVGGLSLEGGQAGNYSLTAPTSSADITPAAIDHYHVTVSAPTYVNHPFITTAIAKDAYGNTVTTDSGTVVTFTSSSANMLWDGDGDTTYEHSETAEIIATLTNGVTTIRTKDNSEAFNVTITATDSNSKTGTSAPFNILNMTGAFRSFKTGLWSDTNTWETYNGSAWVAAIAPPVSGPGCPPITIQTNHVVTLDANVSEDELLIESGGQLTINSGRTLTLHNNDSSLGLELRGLLVNNGAVVCDTGCASVVYDTGVFRNAGTVTSDATTLKFYGGTYQHAQEGGTIPTAAWLENSLMSVCEITGYTSGTAVPVGLNQAFKTFVWNSPGQTAQVNLGSGFTGADNLVISNTHSGSILLGANFTAINSATVSSGATLYCADKVIGGGSFTLAGGATLGIGSADGIVSAGTASGNILTITRSFSTAANYIYMGTADQAAGSGLPATVNSLTDNNAGHTLTLVQAETITTTLTEASGAKISLPAGTTSTAANFVVNGVGKAAGSWGSDSSTANHQNNTYFASTDGLLNVGSGVVSAFSGLTASQSITYGAATITLSGTLSAPGSIYPANGETITITINGGAQTTTTTGGNGSFTISYSTATLPHLDPHHDIHYSYAGSDNLNPATDASTTLTVNPAALTVTANNQTKFYGATLTLGSGQTAFTSSGLKNSESIGSVTLAASGGMAPGDSVGSYTITPTLVAGGSGGFDANNYSITYNSGTLNVIAPALKITAATGTPAAGVDDTLTISFVDSNGATVTTLNGDYALTFGGLATVGNGTHPTVTDKTGAPVQLGTATTITFVNGVSSAGGVLKACKAEGPVTLTGTDGVSSTSDTGGSGAILTILAGAANHLEFTTQPSASTVAGVAFVSQPVVRIEDQYDNVVTSGDDATRSVALTLTAGAGTLGGTVSMAAVNGVADFSGKGLSIDKVGLNKVLTATATLSGSVVVTAVTSPEFRITLPPISLLRGPGAGLKIHASTLLTDDAAWDSFAPLTFVSCTTTTNNVSPAISGSGNATLIVYPSSAANVADSFQYTISDSNSDSWTGSVNLIINTNLTGQSGTISVAEGRATMTFYGVPGYHYVVQRTTDVDNGPWADIAVTSSDASVSEKVITAPSGGAFTVTDGSAPGSSAYYRLRAAP